MAGLSVDADGDDIDDYGKPIEQTNLFNLETGEGHQTLSWISYMGSIKDSEIAADGSLHEVPFFFLDIYIQWTKARTCADCWREELILLEEEMRRVLEFCGWKARWWDKQVNCGRDVTMELAEGLRAYALAQAARERKWETTWREKWSAVRELAKIVMWDHVMDVTELVPLEVELDDELEEEDEYDGFEEEEDLL
ncbi:hypothetical protein MVEN_02614600 [Mycena venus]|uniref:Uncharacterized protein n=1 Tax=Mycena venus TaxID=2733690 RepID=A0A8H6TZ96_9AGAR|nr:hypothetical protein MVEN_02614600 [Mycena venus]